MQTGLSELRFLSVGPSRLSWRLSAKHSIGFCFSFYLLAKPIIGKRTERQDRWLHLFRAQKNQKIWGNSGLWKLAVVVPREGSPQCSVEKLPSVWPFPHYLLNHFSKCGRIFFPPLVEKQNKIQRENPSQNFLSPKGSKITVSLFQGLCKEKVSWTRHSKFLLWRDKEPRSIHSRDRPKGRHTNLMSGGQARMGKNWPLGTQVWVLIWVGGPANGGLWAESSAMCHQKKKKKTRKGREKKGKRKKERAWYFSIVLSFSPRYKISLIYYFWSVLKSI